MNEFSNICDNLNVPIAPEKTIGPTTVLEYLGYTIDTIEMRITLPQDKVNVLLSKINNILTKKKVSKNELESLVGSLNFCTKAIPAGRAFNRRMYTLISILKKPFHLTRVNYSLIEDLLIWKWFLVQFNGIVYIQDTEWHSNVNLQLFSDAAGGNELGCGTYFNGEYAVLNWPKCWWNTCILRDVTFLELIPIALSIYMWGHLFRNKRIVFHTDNEALVYILNNKTSKSERVMSLVRIIVLRTLIENFQFKAKHIAGVDNKIADALSRGQMQRFRSLAPKANADPNRIPTGFLDLLKIKQYTC